MKRYTNLFTVFAFALLILGLPLIASAQWRNDDDDYRNNRRNNGNYRNLQGTIRSLKSRAQQFERLIDRELDRSRYDDRNREDRINNLADDFARATDRLDDEYDNRRDYNDSADEARNVLQLGSQLERALSRARLNYNVENYWNQIRQDLRVLSDAYNYNYNNRNRNNRTNRNNRNDDWRRNIPFPLPF